MPRGHYKYMAFSEGHFMMFTVKSNIVNWITVIDLNDYLSKK